MSIKTQTYLVHMYTHGRQAFFLMILLTPLLYGTSLVVAQQSVPKSEATSQKQAGSFGLSSSAVSDGGNLPVEFTGDGASATLPLAWSNAPAGTMSYAMIMHHLAPDRIKWYWILYNIPSNVHSLPKNVKNIGTWGNNSVNGRIGYAPPHSKGPGAKTYIYTVYALSSPVQMTVKPELVTRDVLLTAMKGRILGQAELRVVYTRSGDTVTPQPRAHP
ncbi:MAG: YbhB/YbcL family Raf kinase inhibitor-like protein [bacterium]